MRPLLIALVLFTACSPRQPAITRQHTSLAESDCRKATDPADPNETPYLICPGVAGYTLHVRQVESGRTSLDVMDPAGKKYPLDYQQVITPAMFALDNKVEWRVSAGIPIALLSTIQAHEDPVDPSKATNTYIAIAKITPQQVCVTDKLSNQAQPPEDPRNRPCLPIIADTPIQ